MLQISSSGVSSVVPNETDKTVYCPLYKVKGKKKNSIAEYYSTSTLPCFCHTHHIAKAFLISLHEINYE